MRKLVLKRHPLFVRPLGLTLPRVVSRVLVMTSAAGALAGCNAPQNPPPVAAAAVNVSVTPTHFRLPDGAGCSGEVARYRAVIANDRATGHVGAKVADTIDVDIDEAAAVCQSGKDAQSIALVRASKTRHGYPG